MARLGLVILQLAGTGLGTPIAPFTTAKESAILTLFHDLMPTLYLGLGPEYTRIVNVTNDVPNNVANITLLCITEEPIIHNTTNSTFPTVRLNPV